MSLISQKLAEETWQEVAGFTPDQARKEMLKLSRAQPDILAYVVEFTKELDQETSGLAIYLFFTVYRMFEKNSPRRMRKISSTEVIAYHERNENFITKLDGVHDKFFDRIAKVQISEQPHVMKYVVDTLMEAPDEDEPVSLSEEDTGYLFLLLKTVIDLLDNMAKEKE